MFIWLKQAKKAIITEVQSVRFVFRSRWEINANVMYTQVSKSDLVTGDYAYLTYNDQKY